MAVTDLVLLDIKEINDAQHRSCNQSKVTKPNFWLVLNMSRMTCRSSFSLPGSVNRDEDLIELDKFVKLLKTLIV